MGFIFKTQKEKISYQVQQTLHYSVLNCQIQRKLELKLKHNYCIHVKYVTRTRSTLITGM